jgi:hypothetical protein
MSASGLARADMLFRNIEVEYGSLQEAMCITYFDYLRRKELLTGSAPLKGENAVAMFEDIKNSIFPEHRLDKVNQLKKNAELMKGLRSKEVWVVPLQTKR